MRGPLAAPGNRGSRELAILVARDKRRQAGSFWPLMKIGLVGLPGCGKSTVFGALTGMAVETEETSYEVGVKPTHLLKTDDIWRELPNCFDGVCE